jgi:hypothetical protein
MLPEFEDLSRSSEDDDRQAEGLGSGLAAAGYQQGS